MARSEARAKGKIEGMAEFACALLTRRLGELPESVEKKIMQLSYLRMQQLCKMLLDFTDQKALQQWLARLARNNEPLAKS